MPKRVCIVGAGPSGLVAAKSLLHDAPSGSFDVTIFEAHTRIGGLWPSRQDDGDGLVHPLMVANQSKHTIQFSDLAWDEDGPQLPRAWQVGRYLERYLQRYCGGAELRLGARVEKAEPVPEGAGWRVQVRCGQGELELHAFDYLLVAAGFFGKPATPAGLATGAEVPVIHSSRYRDLRSLLGDDKTETGGKILIVGGQMSGVEIAGTIASHLSSSVNSPGPSSIPHPEKYTIHHIVQRPTWVFPLFTSPKPSSAAPPFLPLDLGPYNLANRPQPLTNNRENVTVEANRTAHSNLQTSLGTDQSVFSPLTTIKKGDRDRPAYLAMSDNYMEFVRNGLISVSHGKLESLAGRDARISPSDEVVRDVAAVVLATGFDAASSISFLPPSIQGSLSTRATDLKNTLALAFHGTHHPSVPDLGFVGFYRSPYWGIMEMQARFLTALWLAGGPASSTLPPSMAAALASDTSIERTLAFRTDPHAWQFPMGDYCWLMQEFATALGLEMSVPLGEMPRLPPADKPMDILTPARYPSKNLTQEQRDEVARSLEQTRQSVWAGLSSGRFLAKAVFRSLLGKWRLERQLVSRLLSHPSGHFSGTAEFLLRDATAEGQEDKFRKAAAATAVGGGYEGSAGLEYLYVEAGDFQADNGMSFRATRRYVWRYDEEKDTISVWFAKTDDQKRADYLFHEIEFEVPPPGTNPSSVEEDKAKGWQAKAGHLCIDDFYDVKYNFHFQAVNLVEWRLGYAVKGPKKDYTIHGAYRRDTTG